MDSNDMLSEDDNSSSDDSFCEHGYPLHEDPPTVDKISDKAVITVKDDEEDLYDHMFLIPFMRGESPLNETIKQIVALNYEPDPLPKDAKQVKRRGFVQSNGDIPDIGRDGNIVPLKPDLGFSHGEMRNDVSDSVNPEISHNNSKTVTDKGPQRSASVMMAKQAAPSIDDDTDGHKETHNELNGSDGNPMFKGPEYYKLMMGALWSNPLEKKIKEIANLGITEMAGKTADDVGETDKQFSDYSKLLSELSSAMDESLKDSKCEYDGKEKPFVCKLCDWAFSSEEDLNNHSRLHSGERPYQCEYCIGNFQDKTALLNHRRQHTGEKPFKCDICGTAFSQKHSLVVHKNVHTGEKKYKCDLCDSSFVCRSNLNVHMRIHTGAKPYTCEFCHSSYAQKSQLTVHKRMHTGEKPYKCQLCPAAFAVRGHLIHHIRVHTGEKPFKCDECGSAFTKRCNLRVHMRAHTGEKPYRCQFCDQAFHLKNMLTKHLLNFHRIAKKMPTPPQKEGDPPPSPLHGLVPPIAPKGSGRPNTVARIPGPAKSQKKSQPDGSLGAGTSKTPKNQSGPPTPTSKPSKSGQRGQKNQNTPQNSTPSKVNTPTAPKSSGKQNNSTPKSKRSANTKNNSDNSDSSSTEPPDKAIKLGTKSPNKLESNLMEPKPRKANHLQDDLNSSGKPEVKASSRAKPNTSKGEKSKQNNDTVNKKNIKSDRKVSDKTKPNNMEESGNNAFASEYFGHNIPGFPNNRAMGYPGFPTAPWSNHTSGYQSSPVAQRMAQHLRQSSPGTPNAAMKSIMDTYAAAGITGSPLPGMMEAYREMYSGMLGNSSSSQNVLGQRLPGASGPLSPSYSEGPYS